ncbi:uncharacterized protein LOC135810439 [Sycon ciliatum]|uniref:uncharacterized protein LOC135810439 n=1 Tax=Sycon ciliatum TaxID=27933 RepID=UPI0031F6073B
MKSTKCPWRCGDGYVSVWRAMRLLPFLVILSGLSGLANSVRLVGESEIGNGNNATVTWLTEESDSEPYIGSNEKDEVRLYCSDENPLDSSTLRDDHIDHWHIPDILIQSESNLPYNGTVAFGPLINMRVTCQIIFWKYNSTGQDQHLPLFPSNAHKLTVGRGPLQPMQAHLSLTADPSVVYLTWVSSYVSNYNPSVWYHESAQPGAVSTSQAGATTYAAGDMCGAKAVRVEGQHFRDPGAIYSAALANLKPATNYSYWFGIDKANTGGMSPVHWFLSPKLSASNAHIVATADMGAWGGSNPKVDEWQSPIPTIMQRILTVSDTKPVDLVAIYGDLSYANGEGHVWERYFYRLEPVATRIPLHVAIGNHEYDYDRSTQHPLYFSRCEIRSGRARGFRRRSTKIMFVFVVWFAMSRRLPKKRAADQLPLSLASFRRVRRECDDTQSQPEDSQRTSPSVSSENAAVTALVSACAAALYFVRL